MSVDKLIFYQKMEKCYIGQMSVDKIIINQER